MSVSVIIVTRRRADVLPGCLDSISRQTPLPDQIVIVAADAESFPDALYERYRDLPITLAPCPEPNISRARNIGIDHASGELALFIDDDAIARDGWIQAYAVAFEGESNAWAAGGVVLDARHNPKSIEFAHGLIRRSGTQIEARDPRNSGLPRGFVTSVKGCNFALRLDRIPKDLRFDEFFRFAFDETDLIMRIHEQGGRVIDVPGSLVEHLHAPGLYRASDAMDRDWRTEFASHTRFMLKHTSGWARLRGWCVVLRRLAVHTLRAVIAVGSTRVTCSSGFGYVREAIAGIRHAMSLSDTD